MKRKRAYLKPEQPKAFSRRAGLFVRLNLTLPADVARALRDFAVQSDASISLTGERAIRFYLGLEGT